MSFFGSLSSFILNLAKGYSPLIFSLLLFLKEVNTLEQFIDAFIQNHIGKEELISKLSDSYVAKESFQLLEDQLSSLQLSASQQEVLSLLHQSGCTDGDYILFKESSLLSPSLSLSQKEELISQLKHLHPSFFSKPLLDSPSPPDSLPPSSFTKEQFLSMSYQEKLDLYHHNHELYNSFTE